MPTPEQIAAALAFADGCTACTGSQTHLKVLAESARPVAKTLDEWSEDDGPAVWWALEDGDWLGEPSWIGSPIDDDWPGYHTHWTPHPTFPLEKRRHELQAKRCKKSAP